MPEPMQIKKFSWRDATRRLRKKFGVRHSGLITAIEIDGQTLRLVQIVAQDGRTFVTHIAAEQIQLPEGTERSDPVAVGAAINKVLDRLNLKGGAVVMGVPRAQVVLRSLSLPASDDPRELASMVHFQISKDLPFPLQHAVIDFTVRHSANAPARLDSNGKANGSAAEEKMTAVVAPPKLEVLVAAIQREVLDFYNAVAGAAGLNLVALGWLSHANARCVEACRVAAGDECVALVSLRPDEVGIDVIAKNSLIFSRGVKIKMAGDAAHPTPAPASQVPEKPSEAATVDPEVIAQPENFVDAVTIEVVRSLHSHGGIEPQATVAKVVVAGATGNERAIAEALRERLNISCDVLDAASALDLPATTRDHASGSISALGLAFGVSDPQGLPIDFLNPKRPPVQRNVGRIRILLGTTAASALLVGLLGVRSHLVNQRLKIQRQVQSDLAAAEKLRPTYRKIRQQATTVSDWVRDGRDWLEHYAYLSAVLPNSQDLYVTSLSVSGPGIIRLAVQARSGEVLANLDKQLRSAGYDVKPLAITPGNDRFNYNFRSTVELIVPEKLKIELAKAKPSRRPADDASLDPANTSSRKGTAP